MPKTVLLSQMRALPGLIYAVGKTGLVKFARVEHHADNNKHEGGKEEQQHDLHQGTMTFMIDFTTLC